MSLIRKRVLTMPEDPRSCGTIACIINSEGRCWCGLKWDGQKMARAPLDEPVASAVGKARKAAAKPIRKVPAKKARTAR